MLKQNIFFLSLCCRHHIFLHSGCQLSWHSDAGSEQVAGALMKTKQPMERVNGRGRPGAAAANLFCLIMRLVKNLSAVCHIGFQGLEISAGFCG